MKVKLNNSQYQKLLNEVGGYDDPNIGAQDEEAMMKTLFENYMKFRDSMDVFSSLVEGILVQDRLKHELGKVRNDFVGPMNDYSKIMVQLKSQMNPFNEDDF